jgi:hypothetical protein
MTHYDAGVYLVANPAMLAQIEPRLPYIFTGIGAYWAWNRDVLQEPGGTKLPERAARAIIARFHEDPETFEHIFKVMDTWIRPVMLAHAGRADFRDDWALNSNRDLAAKTIEKLASERRVNPLHLVYGVNSALADSVGPAGAQTLLNMLIIGPIETSVVEGLKSVTDGKHLGLLAPRASWTEREARDTLCSNFLGHPQAYALLKAGCNPQHIRNASDPQSAGLLLDCLITGVPAPYAVAALAAGLTDPEAISEASKNGVPLEYLLEVSA